VFHLTYTMMHGNTKLKCVRYYTLGKKHELLVVLCDEDIAQKHFWLDNIKQRHFRVTLPLLLSK